MEAKARKGKAWRRRAKRGEANRWPWQVARYAMTGKAIDGNWGLGAGDWGMGTGGWGLVVRNLGLGSWS